MVFLLLSGTPAAPSIGVTESSDRIRLTSSKKSRSGPEGMVSARFGPCPAQRWRPLAECSWECKVRAATIWAWMLTPSSSRWLSLPTRKAVTIARHGRMMPEQPSTSCSGPESNRPGTASTNAPRSGTSMREHHLSSASTRSAAKVQHGPPCWVPICVSDSSRRPSFRQGRGNVLGVRGRGHWSDVPSRHRSRSTASNSLPGTDCPGSPARPLTGRLAQLEVISSGSDQIPALG